MRRWFHSDGFVLVMSLVIMTFVFTVAASLILNRRMEIAIQDKMVAKKVAYMMGSADMFSLAHYAHNLTENSPQFSLSGMVLGSDSPVGSLFSQDGVERVRRYGVGDVSPNWEYSGDFSLDYYGGYADEFGGYRLNLSDRVFGLVSSTWSNSGFNEIGYLPEGGGSVDRYFDTKTSTLRAWAPVIGAAPINLSLRRFPVSVFTLFVVREGREPSYVVALGDWLQSRSDSYDFGGYSVSSLGVGRVYVESPVVFSSHIVSGFPLFVGSFLPSGGNGSLSFVFPSHLGGGVSSQFSGGQSQFYSQFMYDSKGMAVSLLRSMNHMIFPNSGSSNYDKLEHLFNVYSQDSDFLRVSLNVNKSVGNIVSVNVYPPVGYSFDAVQEDAIVSSFSFDPVRDCFIFSPPLGFLGQLPVGVSSFFFEARDTEGQPYVVAVDIPSVSGLGGDSKLTLVSETGLGVLGDFNADNEGAAMLVSPYVVFFDPPSGASASPPVFCGVLVTSSLEPSTPVYNSTSHSFYRHVGSLVVMRRQDMGSVLPKMSVRLSPDVSYLSGQALPDKIPSVVSLPIYSSGFEPYRMIAKEPPLSGMSD